MARNFKEKSSLELEFIIEDSAKFVGIEGLSEQKAALLLRLILSGISKHFFLHPDDSIRAGFIELHKNPAKEELFSVNLIRSDVDGIVNADSLARYYKGELAQEKQLKNIVNQFVENLLDYAQEEESNASSLADKLKNTEAIDETERKKLVNQRQWKARRKAKLKDKENKKSSRQRKEGD